MNKKIIAYALGGVLIVGSCLSFFTVPAFGATSSINVGLTIPPNPAPPGGSNNQPPIDNAASISNVVATLGENGTTATITWSASDDNGITAVAFHYGTTVSYGSVGTVFGSYQTNISNLVSNTRYLFRITVTDSIGHVTENTGTFTTSDVTAPTISAITVLTNVTTATLRWHVSELATSQISYGLTVGYGINSDSENGSALSHSVSLFNLLSNTTYHYRLTATDAALNSSSTLDATFTTAPDVTPPANPTNVTATVPTNSIILSWTNPSDSDFSGIIIVRKDGSAPASKTDGITIYTGSDQTYTDASVSDNIIYYYALYTFDTSQNYSSGAGVNARVVVLIPNEICGNGVDDDTNGQIDCADSACSSRASCQPAVEICNNSIDDDSDGKTDCADSACSGANYCAVVAEVCGNGIDDNNNGKTDCDDIACFAFAACTGGPTVYNPPTSTVSAPSRLNLSDLQFLALSRSLALYPINGTVSSLAGTTLTVGVKQTSLASSPTSIVLVVDGSNRYQMVLSGDVYYTDSVFPRSGVHMSGVEVDYGNGVRDSVSFTLQGLSYGTVRGADSPLEGVALTLLDANGSAVSGLPPTFTGINGSYGLVVPNGTYSLLATKKGFYNRSSPSFLVSNNVVNADLDLIQQPPDLLDAISATSTLTENVSNIAKNLGAKTKAVAERGVQKIKDTAEVVDKFTKDPVVQQQASQVVAPTAVTVTAVGTIAIASWGNLLPFLRLLFLQPLLLLGLKRRKGWGQVYNTLNKMPVDLATLRLINAETGKVVQSKVTDKEGRYAFVANPGKYTIQVMKNNFSFPSLLLAQAKSDGRRTDIYHGEIIEVTAKDAVITANIPLDPAGEFKKPIRIFWQRFGRAVQIGFSWVGLLVTVVSLYISPRWYVWVLFVVHILFFVIFRRLAVPKKIKSWGITYDSTSKKPIGRVIARLFNSEFNKLVATQITDGSGRYYFLASDDKYYVTYDHPEYTAEKTNVLDLGGKEAENIAVDVGLSKGSKTIFPTTPAPTSALVPLSTSTPIVITPPAQPAAVLPLPIDMNNPPEPPAQV